MKIENKTPIAEEIIRNNPTGHGLFAGIGDNFNSVAQVICELMDDAVSNLRANRDDPELSMRVRQRPPTSTIWCGTSLRNCGMFTRAFWQIRPSPWRCGKSAAARKRSTR